MTLDSAGKKQIIRDLFEDGWNRQQFASFSAHIAESVAFNFRGDRQVTNLKELKGLVAFWRAAFPDLAFEVLDIIVDQDLAAANLVFTGTHEGAWKSVPPAGRKIRVEEMMFFRFEGGRIVELWEVYDEAVMMAQLKAGGGPAEDELESTQ